MKTYLDKNNQIRTLDAQGRVLGRLATEIASILRGKDQPTFAPNRITGDKVIVTNASTIKVTGRKLDQKVYYRHTGYIGGLKEMKLREMIDKHPERVIEYAVYGMLPANRLRKELMKRLTVYPGPAPESKES